MNVSPVEVHPESFFPASSSYYSASISRIGYPILLSPLSTFLSRDVLTTTVNLTTPKLGQLLEYSSAPGLQFIVPNLILCLVPIDREDQKVLQ